MKLIWIALVLAMAPLGALAEQQRGPVTNLPMPRYVSLKAAQGNMRRGPSLAHRIDWVLTRRDMPLRITAEHGHWRKVQDRDGAGGWVHYSLLSGARSVIVEADMLPLLARPTPNATVRARLSAGVIASLGECEAVYCKLTLRDPEGKRHKGWARKEALWGVAPDEIRD